MKVSECLEGEDGIALVAAVWAVLLLSLLAAGVLAVTLEARRTVASIEADVKDRLVARSAVQVFMSKHFYTADEKAVFSASVDVFARKVAVSVAFESGKININHADGALLSALFRVAGKSEQDALSLAASIMDWRDRDDEASMFGAEAAQYHGQGREYGPRNGPFETIGEVMHVLGMDMDLFYCIRPFITVTSDYDSRAVDLVFASNTVRNIFLWAYRNGWQGAAWPNPEVIAQAERSVDIKQHDLSGQSMTLRLDVPGVTIRRFQTEVRYITRGSYAHLTPVIGFLDDIPTAGCALV